MKTILQINRKNNFYLPSESAGTTSKSQSIVILDPTVPDIHHITSGITRGSATYILESQPNAIEQIATILAQHQSIEFLHIISHGSPGSLHLGTTELKGSNIANYSQQLQQWRNALSANASIILYGCNVAAGDRGRQFLTQLHQFTGANIAANSQPTGNSKLGGTWDIPQLIPPSPQRPKLALTETSLKSYSGILGFNPKVDFTTGTNPRNLSIGDFNGDGKPDLATANQGSNTASILLNTTATNATTPTFATKVDFTTGTNPRNLSIGDFNGDGKPDLAVANQISNTVSILLNTTPTNATTPTFATKVDFTTGNQPLDLSISDINGDGKPDLAVANQGSNSASILLNTTATGASTPTFATKVDFTTGTNPVSVSIGDINGDGKPDLAVANYSSNTASILLNTTATGATTPTFATKVDFTTGTQPASVSIGDINGDGKPDLAVANRNSDTASILLNTTPTNATTPTFATKVDFTTGSAPRSVSIGDINGDGLPDLAVANFNSNTASILLNTTATGATTPTFNPKVDFATGSDPFSVSIGDFNGDGLPDLAVANPGGNSASILLNNTPKVTSVTATTADGSYGVGSTINITVTFNAAVNVTGTPRLQLETGTTDQFATYSSGSGGTALTFNYVVQAGDTSADLEYLSTNALTLNGGTIKETAATAFDAFLTLPTLATANSLGGSKAIVIDTVAPTVALTSTSATTINGAFSVTATFSEDVTGFDNTDLTVGNGTVSNFVTVDAKTYTFDVTPTADGSVTVDIPAAKATDAAGNNNTAATQLTRTADITAPTVTLASTSATTVNSAFTVTATFSEDVTGFDNTDLTVGNGTVSNFTTVNGKTYTFDVTPTADGSVTVDIPASKATDAVGNNNTAATQLTRTADVTAPTVTLASTSATTINSAFTVTATFSEDVTGFDNTDLTVGNGTVSNFVPVDAKTYTFDVTPNADGSVTVDIPANQATDAVGNNNTAATQLNRTADVTAPTVTLASTSATTINSAFTVTATFSEDVTGFDNTDLTVGNGTVSNFVPVDAKTYTFDVTPTADGSVTVDIPASKATDAVGNNNTAATQLTRTADVTAPTVTLASTSAATVNSAFTVTATFSEDVTGFDNTDLTVGNATVSNFVTVDAKTYTFNVTPTADGSVTVDIPAAKATDTAGNNNTAATQLTRTADVTAPTVTLASTSATTINAPFSVTATFSEDVIGFDNTDITVANATVSNFATVNGKTYTFNVTPTADGSVTVDIPAAKATDAAGNNNSAATQLTRTADVTAPTANLGAISNITTAVGISQTLTVTFTDSSGVDISSLDNSDLVINWSGSAIAANFVSVDSNSNGTPRTATYSFIPPGGSWDAADNAIYTVNLQASQVKDTAGNFAAASSLGTFNVNIATPTPTPTPTPIPIPTPTPIPIPTPTPSVTPTPTPIPSLTPTPIPLVLPTLIPSVTPTPTPTPSVTPTPTPTPITNNIPDDSCICDKIVYPELNQPNPVENTIIGIAGFQIGTAKNDEFLGNNSGNIFDASSGDDNLYGGDSNDIFNGNKGKDFITGGNGEDILYGDEDNDIIIGELGNDLIFGGKGSDSLNGREGNDIILGNKDDDFIDGGKENDVLYGGKGNDTILGGQGNDNIFGHLGNDTICGGVGNDLISGNEQSDVLSGCEGNDTLYGGEDNDTLTGCQGDDILYGDLGNDSLIGGSGNDIFVLKAGQGFDTIGDFTVGQDLIGLSGGLSFGQLEFTENNQGTIIKNLLTGEQLAITIAVSKSVLTSASFLLV